MLKRGRVFLSILFVLLVLCESQLAVALVDSDGDLLPNDWELANFGNPTIATPYADPDGDRLSNIDEVFANTNPNSYTSIDSLSENQNLKLLQGKSFLYFWEQSEPPYYFTHDNANYNGGGSSQNFNSNAATGFSFVAYAVADENDWVEHSKAYARIKLALARLVELQAPASGDRCVALNQQGNRHGYTYHFVDNNGFRSFNNVEISTIDHALLTAGALVAASYYRGTEVEALAEQLFQNTQWNWLFNSSDNFFYQGWLESCPSGGNYDGGTTLDAWNRYSELMILLFQAMSASPLNGVGSIAWEAQARGSSVMFPYEWADITPGSNPQNFAFLANMLNVSEASGFTNTATRFRYIHAGSIHNHQYSHMYADFRKRRDGFRQTDFFSNSINATEANREFCIQLNSHAFGGDPNSPDPYLRQPYETYGQYTWGLLAGITSDALYKVMQPIIMPWDDFSSINIAANNDSGTVFMWAPVGSTSFTPHDSIDFTRDIFDRFQHDLPGFDALVGRYGFMNSFNLGRGFYRTDPPGHYSSAAIGIDIGAAVGGIENYLSGLVWKHAMRRPEITNGMGSQGAGFEVGVVEPFILNFDDNPPAPHEDPNGGGQDPNSFGGDMYPFGNPPGSASITYSWIGDPRPDIPYGPQDFAIEITAAGAGDYGGFIRLNNHSVSNWGRVSFWVKGDTGNEDFYIGLKDSVTDYMGKSLSATEVKLPIKDFTSNNQIPTAWTEIRIPLEEFLKRGVRLTRLDNISFSNFSATSGRIYVDDIAFLPDEFAPQAPQNVQSLIENGMDTRISWNESSETDVVGYHVYRRRPNESQFTRLTNTLVIDRSFLDTGAAYETFEYAVTAVDNAFPQNESTFSNVFQWSVHHDLPYFQTETFSSAGAAKIILNYLHAANLTQSEIYNYGFQYNLTENKTPGSELDPRGIDAVLGHFDPYDASLVTAYNSYDSRYDGNPYEGYNFSIVTKPSTSITEYMRDICHWMDYPVPLYRGSQARTNPEKVPPVVPIFGTYDRWVVVNGFSSSADPLPNENDPWNTPSFIVYGFWLTDPDESGIGVNRYVTAEESSATYFRPMITNDAYLGKYVLIAEPPLIRSKGVAYIAKSVTTDDSLATASALKVSLDSAALSSTQTQLSASVETTSYLNLNWSTILPGALQSDAAFRQAFSDTMASRVYRVERLDKGYNYRLITFDKQSLVNVALRTTAVLILDEKTGVFKEATWAATPTNFVILDQRQAVQAVLNYLGMRTESSKLTVRYSAKLFWTAGHKLSSSPFNPIWQIELNGCLYEVTQSGRVYAKALCSEPLPTVKLTPYVL